MSDLDHGSGSSMPPQPSPQTPFLTTAGPGPQGVGDFLAALRTRRDALRAALEAASEDGAAQEGVQPAYDDYEDALRKALNAPVPRPSCAVALVRYGVDNRDWRFVEAGLDGLDALPAAKPLRLKLVGTLT